MSPRVMSQISIDRAGVHRQRRPAGRVVEHHHLADADVGERARAQRVVAARAGGDLDPGARGEAVLLELASPAPTAPRCRTGRSPSRSHARAPARAAPAAARSARASPDRSAGPTSVDRQTAGQVRRHRREHVAAVEGRARRARRNSARLVICVGRRDAADLVRREREQAVVGPDQQAAVDGLDHDGAPLRADARIDDGDVDADRRVGQARAPARARPAGRPAARCRASGARPARPGAIRTITPPSRPRTRRGGRIGEQRDDARPWPWMVRRASRGPGRVARPARRCSGGVGEDDRHGRDDLLRAGLTGTGARGAAESRRRLLRLAPRTSAAGRRPPGRRPTRRRRP